MAKSRKDNKGRALRKGETQRSCDGMYVYTYTYMPGKRKSIYAKNLSELREREAELQRNQLDGLDIYVAGKASLNYVFDRYIATKREIRENTLIGYKYTYNHYIREGFGKKLISKIKYSDMIMLYSYFLHERELAVGTLESIHTVLNPMFEMAVKDKIIRDNPCKGAMKEVKKRYGKKKIAKRALTIEQQRAFLNFIMDNEELIYWLPIFVFMFGTGCRVGEVIGLRWDDIDFENRVIHIKQDLIYLGAEKLETRQASYVVHSLKTTASRRDIPMMDDVYDALKCEWENQEVTGFNTSVIDGLSGFVFKNRYGKVQNGANLNRTIKRIYEAYNAQEIVNAKREHRKPIIIPHFSCHVIRHTFCTRLCESGMHVKTIASIMGHDDIQTTMNIYADVSNKMLEKAKVILDDQYDMFGKGKRSYLN